jgi:chromosome segregation ATPase
MSEITEMIENIVKSRGSLDRRLADVLRSMASRLEKMEQLEKDVAESRERIIYLEQMNLNGMEKQASLEMKGRIIDTLCEQCKNFESFQARTDPCINTLLRDLGVLERKQETYETLEAKIKKFDDSYFIIDSNIETIFRANVDRNKEYQKLTEKYNREFAECNKDIIGTHMTLMNYKRENEKLDNRISDLYAENQSRDNGIDTLRLKLIDVLDEVEKNTSEAAEIKRMAIDIYGKNREYDRNFGAVMSRMSELESAMKTVTVHWSDIRSIKERIEILERTCFVQINLQN